MVQPVKQLLTRIYFLFLFLLPLSTEVAGAAEAIESLSTGPFNVFKVEIEGLVRTEDDVVLRELTFEVNPEGVNQVSQRSLDESIQRIRNLQIFSSVDFELVNEILVIRVKEKWTTIPILKLSGGGGKSRFTIGAYDPNVLGQYLELGAQLERLGDENSAVVWYRNPRLFGKRLELFATVWNITRSETVYQDLGRSNKVEGALFIERKKASFSIEKEWMPWLRAGLSLELNQDLCSPNLINETDPELRSQILRDHQPETTAIIPGGQIKLGGLNHNSFLIDGVQFEYKLQSTGSAIGSTTQFTSNDALLLAYKTILNRSTLALRIGTGITDTRSSQYYYFLGGLDKIRGFEAGRFYGRHYWLTNLEFRMPVLDESLYVLQLAGFADAIGVSLNREAFTDLTAASTGVGVRIVAPTVYRLVLRLDYALPLKNEGLQPLSFGIQQFF